jgi:chromosome segregation ATPase
MALVAVGLATAILCIQHRSTSANATLSRATSDRDDAADQGNSLRVSMKRYHDLLSRYQADKEKVIGDIADFRNQLDMIKQKVAGLERVRDQLQQLGSSFDRFKASEKRFLRELKSHDPKAGNEAAGAGGST